jgi:hypothetical protein
MSKIYFVEILCSLTVKGGNKGEKFIESGIAVVEPDFVVYCEENQYLEIYRSLKEFKDSLVFEPNDFNKYVKITLLE